MKENFVERLLKFVDEHGGVYEVAGKVDVSPQTFYTMRRRGSLPNLGFIYSLKEKFPELDLNWLMFGEKDKETVDVSKYQDLQKKLERAEAIVDRLVGKHKGATLFSPGGILVRTKLDNPIVDKASGKSINYRLSSVARPCFYANS